MKLENLPVKRRYKSFKRGDIVLFLSPYPLDKNLYVGIVQTDSDKFGIVDINIGMTIQYSDYTNSNSVGKDRLLLINKNRIVYRIMTNKTFERYKKKYYHWNYFETCNALGYGINFCKCSKLVYRIIQLVRKRKWGQIYDY